MKKKLLSSLICVVMLLQTAVSVCAIQNDKKVVNVTFDDVENNLNVLSTTFTSDGINITSAWPGGSPTVKVTDSGFVADNPSGNQYIEFTYASGSKPGEITITPVSPLTEDFVVEFKYALNNTWPASGYWPINNMMLGLEFYMQKSLTSNYLSRAFNMAEDGTICVPGFNGSTQSTSGTGTNSSSEKISTYSGGAHFDTVKVMTRFNADNGYPVCDIYVKSYGSSDFVLKKEGMPFSKTTKDGKTRISASDYNQGIGKIGFNLPTVGSASNRVAIDDIRIYSITLDSIYSDGMVIPKNSKFVIRGEGFQPDSYSEAKICKADGTQILKTSAVVDSDTQLELSFENTSILSEEEQYYIDIEADGYFKRINDVVCGNVIVFDGDNGYAEKMNENNNTRIFKDGRWYKPGEYTGYDYECSVLGNSGGAIVGVDEIAYLPANCVVYTVSDNVPDDFSGYIEPIIEQGKKIIFSGVTKNTSLADEEIFEVENRSNNISKLYFGDVFFVPIYDCKDYSKRLGEVASGEKECFNYWDINVNNNIVYLTLNDIPKSAIVDNFLCEDIDGNIYSADSVNINGKTLELSFEKAEKIMKLLYGGNTIENSIYSSEHNMPLPRFSAEFMASEKYDFSKQYDREKFISIFEVDNASVVGSDGEKIVLSQKKDDNFSIERKNLYYSTDNVEIKIGVEGTRKVKLISDGKILFEGVIGGEDTIALKRDNDKVYVNSQELAEDISILENLKLEFCECESVVLNKFEIVMPDYSKILKLISDINNLPDEQNAKYTDKTVIQDVYEDYIALSGDNNSYLSDKQKMKMNSLGNLLKKYLYAEQKMSENVLISANIPTTYIGSDINQKIKISNKNEDIPYSMICVAVVYSKDRRIMSISAQDTTIQPNEENEINLKINAKGGQSADIYVLSNICEEYEGYMLYNAFDIPIM